jgi:hypothetical protein
MVKGPPPGHGRSVSCQESIVSVLPLASRCGADLSSRLMKAWAVAALCSSPLAGAGCCLATAPDDSTSGGVSAGHNAASGTSVGLGSVGAATSTGSSSGVGASGRSSSTGGTGGGNTGGGCVSGVSSNQFDSCADTGRCGCPYECVYDPLAYIWSPNGSSTVCESTCQFNSDCELVTTACVGGLCVLIACGGAYGNGIYNSTCSMADRLSDGTCALVFKPDGGTDEECFEAGSANDGGCNYEARTRADLASICDPGFACITVGGSGNCEQECDNINIFCPPGADCLFLEGSTPVSGACVPGY